MEPMVIDGVTISVDRINKVIETRGVISPAHVAGQCGLTTNQVRKVRIRLDEMGVTNVQKAKATAAPKKTVKANAPNSSEMCAEYEKENRQLNDQVVKLLAETGSSLIVADIAKRLGADRAATLPIVKRLVKLELVNQKPNYTYHISQKGIKYASDNLGIAAGKKAIKAAAGTKTRKVTKAKKKPAAPAKPNRVNSTTPPADSPVSEMFDQLLTDNCIDQELAQLDSKFMPSINDPDTKLKILSHLQSKCGGQIAVHLGEIAELLKQSNKEAA